MNWETTVLPMDEKFIAMKKPVPVQGNAEKPCTFFEGSFELAETGDTYFDLSNYFKGMVYINGHNLGRYWNIGPQQRLYCPASWLKKGKNEILVFDLLQKNAMPVETKSHLTN